MPNFRNLDKGVFFLAILLSCGMILGPLWRYGARLDRASAFLSGELSWVRQGAVWLARRNNERSAGLGALDEKGAFLEILHLAFRSGVTIESVRPAGVRRERGVWRYDEFLLDVVGRGEEAALFSLTRSLAAGDRMWRLRECDLRGGSEKEAAAAGRWKIGVLRHVRRAGRLERLGFEDVVEKQDSSGWPVGGRKIFLALIPSALSDVPVAPGVERLDDFVLVAVMDDGMPRAALEDRRTNRSLVVRPGDVIDGMRVVEISRGALVLEAAGVIHRLFI